MLPVWSETSLKKITCLSRKIIGFISFVVNIRSSLTHPHGFQLLLLLPEFLEIYLFVCTNRVNLLNLKWSSGRLVMVAKGFLKLPNLHILIKQESITSQKLGSHFWWIANSVHIKGKYAILPLFNGLELLSSASDKAILFARNFSNNSNFDDSVISLPIFPSRTNLKRHNISVTPKMVTRVITNLDSLKACGLDCIPVIVLWAWTFIHTSWTLQYVSEGVLFSRLVEGLIGGPSIYDCWGKVCS